MVDKKELKIAANTIISMCTEFIIGNLKENVFRHNLKLFAEQANSPEQLNDKDRFDWKDIVADIVKDLNLDLSNDADIIERLFCCATLAEGVDVSARILEKYNSLKDVMFGSKPEGKSVKLMQH